MIVELHFKQAKCDQSNCPSLCNVLDPGIDSPNQMQPITIDDLCTGCKESMTKSEAKDFSSIYEILKEREAMSVSYVLACKHLTGGFKNENWNY